MPLSSGSFSSHHLDLIALSLTPFGWRRSLGDALRAGEPPASILTRLLHNRRLNHDGLDRPSLMSRVSAAVARAADRGLFRHQRRQLVAQRLATPGRHDHAGVVACQQAAHNALLHGVEDVPSLHLE